MHSAITDEMEPAWEAIEQGDFVEAKEVAESSLERISREEGDEEPEEDEDEVVTEPSERPPEYWDALIVKMMAQLKQEENAETWDTIEALLPCEDPDYRALAIGMARLGEGLLIRRMEELGSQSDSQSSLERAAEELEDRILSFQGGIRDDADTRDVFLAAFAGILGTGDWEMMNELDQRLADKDDLTEEEKELQSAAENILELEQLCTPEKLDEVREAGIPEEYELFLELMEWRGSDLEDL